MADTAPIVIHTRFCGPPDSANGGYTAGRLAVALGADLGAPVQVRLSKPPPLDTPLDVQARDGSGIELLGSDGALIASAQLVDALELVLPDLASPDEAQDAAAAYDPSHHPFPGCFACGPDRGAGDGMRLWSAPVPDREVFACTWTPSADLAGADGIVRTEFVWSALDCPGGQAVSVFGTEETAVVLGTIVGVVDAPMRVGEPLVITSWRIEQDGRKHITGVAIADVSGRLLGRSRAIWIAV